MTRETRVYQRALLEEERDRDEDPRELERREEERVVRDRPELDRPDVERGELDRPDVERRELEPREVERRELVPPELDRADVERERLLGDGTLAPFSRASDNPIAIACFRLVTVPPCPDFPRFNVPFLRRCIALSTDLEADSP